MTRTFFNGGYFMALTAAALWLNTVFADFDAAAALFIHRLYELNGDFFTPFFEFFSLLGKGGIPLIILGLALLLSKKTRRCGTAILLGLAVGALITNCCVKILVARPRPYSNEDSIFYRLWLTVGQNMESDMSFPSGHTTAAMAASTAVFLSCDKRWSWTAFLFAIVMGIARIYLVVHYASDVLGGFIVGFIGGVVGYLITVKLPKKWYSHDIIKKKE